MALIKCRNCGRMISDKAKACPKCGTIVSPSETEMQNNEAIRVEKLVEKPVEQIVENHELTPAEETSRPLESSMNEEPVFYESEPKEKNNKTLLITLLAVLLVLLGAGGWYWYDSEQKRTILERQLAVQQEQARQDSIAAAQLREQARQDSIAKQTLQDQLEKTKTISSLYMDYWGTIGELSLNCFVMKGQEGYYQFSGADNAKRTLKVASYDKSSRRCKLDAYLRGKYIGAFEGIFDEDQASYQGVFISVRGIKLDFDIGIYGD